MKITDVLNQPLEFQDQFVKEYSKRQDILRAMASYNEKSKELSQTLLDIRNRCTHPLEVVKKFWDEDEYGKMLDSGYIDYTCPDCGAKHMDIF